LSALSYSIEQYRRRVDGIFDMRLDWGQRKMLDEARNPSTRLLVVDDEPEIRTSMVHFLADVGYAVQTAEDGFAALVEIQKDLPDILLSDLNMPGMSGFDLLSVVRQCFPSIQVIAMSGSFSGDEVPSGVFADSFYQKGCSGRSLLRILQELEQTKRRPFRRPIVGDQRGVQRSAFDDSGTPRSRLLARSQLRPS